MPEMENAIHAVAGEGILLLDWITIGDDGKAYRSKSFSEINGQAAHAVSEGGVLTVVASDTVIHVQL